MLFFTNDYGEGMHPELLKALAKTNMEQLPGYGTDKYCQQAAEKIKDAAKCPNGQVFFLNGGTQTNQIVIDSLLQPYEGKGWWLPKQGISVCTRLALSNLRGTRCCSCLRMTAS